MRRLRKNPIIRSLIAETHLSKDMFIYPYFVIPGKREEQTIDAMPGIFRYSIDLLIKEVSKNIELGLNKILLFGTGEEKSDDAAVVYSDQSVVVQAIRALKKEFGDDLYIITDICACAYTTHGHCGILKNQEVQNQLTVSLLCKMALAHARAGADMVAPSDMMDGRVGAIRQSLDEAGLQGVSIMSYAIKYASAYYGPFREAAGSAPGTGDRKGYQLDFRNVNQSLLQAACDEQQGADILMVKPALAYLDIISRLTASTNLPIACYNVSGEYAMIKKAATSLVDEQSLVMENMYAFARAGAKIIITYHAKDILLKNWIETSMKQLIVKTI